MRGCRELDPGSRWAAVPDSCCDQSGLVPGSQGHGAWPSPWVVSTGVQRPGQTPPLGFQPSPRLIPSPSSTLAPAWARTHTRDIYRANEGAEALQDPD